MRLPRIPLFLRFLMLLVLIGAGLVALFWLIVVYYVHDMELRIAGLCQQASLP